MSDISKSVALEIADNWEQMAATERDSSPDRRSTLRECADLIRMMAEHKPPRCPHAGVFTYCPVCVVCPCPIGVPQPQART